MTILGPARLALAHARHHKVRTALLILCVFVAALLPIATRVILGDFEARLLARARSTPLLAGAKGSRFDLVMSALYFRRSSDVGVLTMNDWRTIAESGSADAFPINNRFTARGWPIIATSPDYFTFRSLTPAHGELPVILGEAALGSRVARALSLTPGDTLFSDQREVFDITKPPALKMHITAVLSPTGTPDDDAVFVDIKTAWVLEGVSHGHADAAKSIPDALLLERTKSNVVVSEELVDYNEITPQNLATYHVHANPDTLPIQAIVVVPRSTKDLTLLKARTNAKHAAQMVVPTDAVEEILGYVARVRQLLDALSLVVAGFAFVLIGLVTALSVRVRAREVHTLSRIGAARFSIAAIFLAELAAVFTLGIALAIAVGFLLAIAPPDLVKLL